MSRVDLPDGQWAELDDPRRVTERKRRPYLSAMTAASASTANLPRDGNGEIDNRFFGAEQQAAYDASLDALTVCLVKAWSYDLPVVADSLLDLPVGAVDALRAECGKLHDQLLPNFAPSPDPLVTSAASTTPPTGS